MYAGGEPWGMCAGSLMGLGIGRVVSGIRDEVMRPYLAGATGMVMTGVACRDVFGLWPKPIEVVGPLLEDDAKAPFEAFLARGRQ